MFRTVTIATFLVLAATAAQADSSTRVSYGNLNLSRAEDAKILADRLRAAAKFVCLDANPSFAGKAAMQDCVSATVNAATVQIEERIERRMLGGVRANLASIRQRIASRE